MKNKYIQSVPKYSVLSMWIITIMVAILKSAILNIGCCFKWERGSCNMSFWARILREICFWSQFCRTCIIV